VTITKRELVIRVASKLGMTQSDVAKIVDQTFETLAHTLGKDDRWELRDFGVFEVKTRASRVGRNPRTGAEVPVAARRVVTFRPGKQMREHVFAGASASEEGPAPTPPPETGTPRTTDAPAIANPTEPT